MLNNLPFDEAVVEPRIIVAEERIQNGGLAGVFSRLAGGAGFRGPPGAGKRMLRKKRFTRYSEDFGCGEAQRAGLSLLIANVGREREITGPSTDEQFLHSA